MFSQLWTVSVSWLIILDLSPNIVRWNVLSLQTASCFTGIYSLLRRVMYIVHFIPPVMETKLLFLRVLKGFVNPPINLGAGAQIHSGTEGWRDVVCFFKRMVVLLQRAWWISLPQTFTGRHFATNAHACFTVCHTYTFESHNTDVPFRIKLAMLFTLQVSCWIVILVKNRM